MPYTFKHGDRPLDDFTIQRAVGSGGFGEVYYAVSDGGREVALKYLKSNPQVELRGVSHCINLKSPHLVSIFDVKKSADGEYFIVMEYCSGPSLRDLLIAEPSGFDAQKAAFFLRELGKGLAYLHDRGIVHRDLKPGNIFYDDGYVKIGDYGLSKFISVSRHSAQTASVGTVHYMAPEIGSGDYSRSVDIYAMGVMFYEMLMGKVPFEGSTMAEVLMKHLTTQPELDDLPHPFGEVIRKALAKDPKDRYQNAGEMIEALMEVEDVRKSLDGFSPQSLAGAVRNGEVRHVRPPMPSPNPVREELPPFAKPIAPEHWRNRPRGVPGTPPPLPDRIAKRFDRVSNRVEQRMAKLARKARGRQVSPPEPGRVASLAAAHTSRPHRTAFPVFLLVASSVGLGLIVGNTLDCWQSDVAGAAAGLMAGALSLGVMLSRWAVGWFGVEYGKNWASRVVHAGCCAPLLAIGAAPMFDTAELSQAGLSMWFGLLAVAGLADWKKHFQSGASGELCFRGALWVAVGGLLATMVAGGFADREPDCFALIAAAIAGIAALVAQAVGGRRVPQAEAVAGPPGEAEGVEQAAKLGVPLSPSSDASPADAPCDIEESSEDPLARRRRWDFTRGCWGILSFLLMGGAVITALLAAIGDSFCYEDKTGLLVGCMACISVMVFTIRKTTPVKQLGFAREWFRPFLVTVALFGVFSLTVTITRHWSGLSGDERALVVAGSIISGILLLISFVWGIVQARPRPFLVGDGSEAEAQIPNGEV